MSKILHSIEILSPTVPEVTPGYDPDYTNMAVALNFHSISKEQSPVAFKQTISYNRTNPLQFTSLQMQRRQIFKWRITDSNR
jgi:hypothetical protein